TLGCYGDSYAHTPHLDALARQSVRYTHAFATAPVCSPSRSCLINGLPATSQGTQQMRSAFPIPEFMVGFPTLLRGAGFYTSNNVKTDYNTSRYREITAAAWDESSGNAHWRTRKEGELFFSIFNLMTSHQSRTMVWPYEKFVSEVQSKLAAEEIHDPAKAPVPPYYPDTPVIRKTIARFYDCVTAMDKEVGAILAELEADGLTEDTIVFFYSDHGSGMPRHKRALLDSGMLVPLLVRFPEKWVNLAPGKPGSTCERLVNFADFGPTVLSLAGVDIPGYMEGRAFLGAAEGQARRTLFGHRDRVDEVIDLARSVRDSRFLYIRNYMPHLGYNQVTAWPDLGEIRHEIYAAAARGGLSGPQQHFAGPTRPLEELYDCEADPQNLENLAPSPEYRETLERLRGALAEHIAETRDLGFLAEAQAWQSIGSPDGLSRAETTPWELARSSAGGYDQAALVAAASQVGAGSEEEILANLAAADARVRYWGAVGCSAMETLSPAAVTALETALADLSPTVRIEAAHALGRHDHLQAALAVLEAALAHENLPVVQHAARTVELLGERAAALIPAVAACDRRMKTIRPPGTSPVVVDPDKDMAMFIGFSTTAFLRDHGGK
ncbi:MAG: sulfatase-like hydrolase/transferase, partial [Verrucomicrobiales bacterium]